MSLPYIIDVVSDFGAIGDGVADDTVAIQAALDSASYETDGPYLNAMGTTVGLVGQFISGNNWRAWAVKPGSASWASTDYVDCWYRITFARTL